MRQVHPGVSIQPLQVSSMAGAVAELGERIEDESKRPLANTADPGLTIALKELDLEMKWQ